MRLIDRRVFGLVVNVFPIDLYVRDWALLAGMRVCICLPRILAIRKQCCSLIEEKLILAYANDL